jgi:2-oxo-4-hydroxy-4-carboxy--5-ureidoimidazoline (OHCU) decarboxylase
VHDLPRQLSANELAELFGGRTRFVERLAGREDPLAAAPALLRELPMEEQLEALDAHPRIGETSSEQRGDEPAVLGRLAELNRAYEERFGFRFLVFVDRRSRTEIVPVLEGRLMREPSQELETALDELVAIARDRWQRR